ncbi:MAG: dCTP deaminase [Candidatus Parcubacteria bacterium]|nr:dCTP deaminase [Candidatus Paceibacterota bacterium]
MFLSDTAIKKALKNKEIQISPEVQNEDIRATGIRIHLGAALLVPLPDQIIDFRNPKELMYHKINLEKSDFVLEPGQFVLISTLQKIQNSNTLLPILDGRSTTARCGISIHQTCFACDGMHDRQNSITLEVKNVGNHKVILYYKMPIGTMLFSRLESKVGQKSNPQYKNQNDSISPNLKENAK